MGNCRGCVHVLGERKDFHRGEDVQMFRCGYAEKEFGGERWVAEPLTGDCEAFKSVIPEEGWIEFIRDCNACSGTGKYNGSWTSVSCSGCDGTGKVEMFPND
ncbi:hypothetical protein [Bacillus cereus]|uniref:hypothetical protein n=1 Tax=Bacillus cereus TaxID=1396 RepID=UPI000BF7ECAD|nr:hypothetical protein [Bacillus cereus]PFK68291.1 hypothetical protein COJ25_17290 [Bacillus cereus]